MLIIHCKSHLPLNCQKKAIILWSVTNLNGQGYFRCCWVSCLQCRSTQVSPQYHTCQSHMDVSDTLELVHMKGHQMPLLEMSDITFGPQSSTLQDTSVPKPFATSAIWMSWRAVRCHRCILSPSATQWSTRKNLADQPGSQRETNPALSSRYIVLVFCTLNVDFSSIPL